LNLCGSNPPISVNAHVRPRSFARVADGLRIYQTSLVLVAFLMFMKRAAEAPSIAS
jgi:hypothetical protein